MDKIQAKIDHSNKGMRGQIQVARDQFKKEIRDTEKKSLEMKETINQFKNSIDSITIRLDHLEDRTSGNEDKYTILKIKLTSQ